MSHSVASRSSTDPSTPDFTSCFSTSIASRETNENRNAPTTTKPGIIINVLFILANEICQKVVCWGLVYNMGVCLKEDYHMDTIKANNAVSYWNAATEIMIVLFGFLSDSYTGRFAIIVLGSVLSLLGIVLLYSTAVIPSLRPSPCTASGCPPPTTKQLNYLFIIIFPLISVGAGCVSCSATFAADQLEPIDKSQHKRAVETLFMYYHASSSFLFITSVTAMGHLVDKYRWEKAFGIPLILLALCQTFFFVRSPQYFKDKPKRSLIASLAQVIVASCRNRDLPSQSESYFAGKDSKIDRPTDNLRLHHQRSSTIRDPQRDVSPDRSAVNAWTLCTVEQVEEVKSLARVLPLWSTGIMLWVIVSKPTFMLLQAGSMNRYISEKIEIPRAIFAILSSIIMLLWVLLYDQVILPLASKIKGQPMRIDVKLRMGFGLLLSCIAMVVSAVVEIIKRKKAIREGNSLDMSALWLVPQYSLIGIAEAFTAVGQLEFLYTELPRSMSGVAVALLGPGMVMVTALSDVVSKAVLHVTSKRGKEMSWNDITSRKPSKNRRV